MGGGFLELWLTRTGPMSWDMLRGLLFVLLDFYYLAQDSDACPEYACIMSIDDCG